VTDRAAKKFVLSRDDTPERYFRENPTKACRRCGVEYLNDFDHFGKRFYLRRDRFVTVDVCNACRAAKRAATRAGPGADKLDAFRAIAEGRAAEPEVKPPPPEVKPPPKRPHVAGPSCWCEPTVEFDEIGSTKIWVHYRGDN